MIDEATVRHVATLARLKLSDDQVELFVNQLSKITDYIDQLSEVDVHGVSLHDETAQNTWREDEVRKSMRPEQFLSNAPDQEAEYLKIRKIVE